MKGGAASERHRSSRRSSRSSSDTVVTPSSTLTTSTRKRPALKTLGTFDFAGHILNEFVHAAALPYLEEGTSPSDVVDKLLTVGIADPEIRWTVLLSLHNRFDGHLAQAENVHSLFIAVIDELFENRATAMRLIGRLAGHNPMLFVGTIQRLIKPYALPMPLLRAENYSATIATDVLMCLDELPCVCGEGVMSYVPQLMHPSRRPAVHPSRRAPVRLLVRPFLSAFVRPCIPSPMHSSASAHVSPHSCPPAHPSARAMELFGNDSRLVISE
ncbi:hypothetical protein OBBRIDRAFT_885904 [Obba rivulosa]|uniref:Uncharacterized protein n=1 Tax=Obba rivulosa TaxID=1052685 RepID=A0A8E2AYJ3_9APHY|nr:hypothetical protein OBBRIDRAFT_885904 [Obba rivulosa]